MLIQDRENFRRPSGPEGPAPPQARSRAAGSRISLHHVLPPLSGGLSPGLSGGLSPGLSPALPPEEEVPPAAAEAPPPPGAPPPPPPSPPSPPASGGLTSQIGLQV